MYRMAPIHRHHRSHSGLTWRPSCCSFHTRSILGQHDCRATVPWPWSTSTYTTLMNIRATTTTTTAAAAAAAAIAYMSVCIVISRRIMQWSLQCWMNSYDGSVLMMTRWLRRHFEPLQAFVKLLLYDYEFVPIIIVFSPVFAMIEFEPCAFSAWCCWLGGRKGIWPVKKLSDEVMAWLSVWSKVQMICIWSSWCHCHQSYVALLKSRMVLPFSYRFTKVVLEKAIKQVSTSFTVII